MLLVCDTPSLLAGEQALPTRDSHLIYHSKGPSKRALEIVRNVYNHVFAEPIAWCAEQGITIEWIYPLSEGDSATRLTNLHTPGDTDRRADRCALIKFVDDADIARFEERWGEVYVVTQNGTRVAMGDG